MNDQDQAPKQKGRFEEVYQIVREIPPGQVLSYGQVGALARTTPRVVGWAMASVDDAEIPWQRVVGADGYLRIGRRSPEMMALQHELLQREGVTFLADGRVDMSRHTFMADTSIT